jgi:hypothetical protein
MGTVITKDFVLMKDFCIYTMIFLRQDKTLRDHGAGAETWSDRADR